MILNIEIEPQRIADLMITGIEGGIGYWAMNVEVLVAGQEGWERASYMEADTYRDDRLWKVRGSDAEDGSRWEFSSIQFAKRVALAPPHLADWIAENEDVETADALIQCAAFKEIVFG